MSDVILEIGLEEVPARFMPAALNDLKTSAEKALHEARLSFSEALTYGTPRRLVLVLKNVADRQEDLSEEVRGPSEKVAYGADGTPSKALKGFMASQGVVPADIEIRDGYVFANKTAAGESRMSVLKQLLPELILGLHFPKTMRWGAHQLRYVRPIHWILALCDDQVIPFSLEVADADRLSRGHRHLGESTFAVASVETYFDQLQENYVIVDQNKRRTMIEEQLEALTRQMNGQLVPDEDLLEEIVYLVEYPTALAGHFDDAFLAIPPELVITPMKEHQRYFPVRDAESGALLNAFLTVRNGTTDHLEVVQAGNERVLLARLSDARFFFEEDLKHTPESRLDKLKQVVFQEKLGTVYDKVLRLEKLSKQIAEVLGYDATVQQDVARAAKLAKTDLVSNVVGEFPELQGIIGEVYVSRSGKDNDKVAQAVREHYMPRFYGDATPETDAGAVLALTDKLDTIVGCFAAGIEPTGSQDPYGLRRQASGVIAILLTNLQPASLAELIALATDTLPKPLVADADQLVRQVVAFFDQRMRTVLKDSDFDTVFIDAVLAAGYDDPVATMARAATIDAFRNNEPAAFDMILQTYKRAHNLAEKSDARPVSPEFFEEAAENKLFDAIETYRSAHAEADVYDSLKDLTELSAPLDAFFDAVMIMDERESVRMNRLALLRDYTLLGRDLVDFNRFK